MWKFSLLLLIAGLCAVSSQDLELECSFSASFIHYECELNQIEVLDPALNVVFVGNHLDGRTHENVTYVRINNSNTPFIIQQIFTTFFNIVRFEIFGSNLESISIPPSIQLNWIAIGGNNISRIERDSVSNQTLLGYFNLASNNIEHIDEDAFEGLTSVDSFVFFNNRIRALAPRTFHPLSYVMSIDLEGNLLTRIDEELFANSPNLMFIYLERNQINEIHPRFADNLRGSLRYINLSENVCVGRDFALYEEEDWSSLDEGLTTCFDNFNATQPARRRITMEFEGPLSLFDENGNLIITV